jgi:hypothetical protein
MIISTVAAPRRGRRPKRVQPSRDTDLKSRNKRTSAHIWRRAGSGVGAGRAGSNGRDAQLTRCGEAAAGAKLVCLKTGEYSPDNR